MGLTTERIFRCWQRAWAGLFRPEKSPLISIKAKLPLPNLGQVADGLAGLVAGEPAEVVAAGLVLFLEHVSQPLLVEWGVYQLLLYPFPQRLVHPGRDGFDKPDVFRNLLTHEDVDRASRSAAA